MKLGEYVSKFSYPGRGVALGRSADGKKALMFYFWLLYTSYQKL